MPQTSRSDTLLLKAHLLAWADEDDDDYNPSALGEFLDGLPVDEREYIEGALLDEAQEEAEIAAQLDSESQREAEKDDYPF